MFAFTPLFPIDSPETSVTVKDALEYSMTGFKDSREQASSVFEREGLQPSTGRLPEGETPEDNLKKKRANYRWQLSNGTFVPQVDATFEGLQDKLTILQGTRIPVPGGPVVKATMLLIPQTGLTSMAAIEQHNHEKHHDAVAGDLYDAKNIGLRPDWFTDAVFGQQQFTGVNPTTIMLLTDSSLARHFVSAAESQGNTAVAQAINSNYPLHQLYVQDCSYYRQAAGMGPDEDITQQGGAYKDGAPVLLRQYGSAAVVLFTLEPTGKLHPLAITLDHKANTSENVTIFNKRLSSADTAHDEKTDWPWRYAKTVAQTSDWARHEMTIHLTNTHLIEETIIVAAQRTLPDSHILLQILNAHWTTTLSLNALAQPLLVPKLIQPVSPFSLPQVTRFIQHARSTYDFAGSYVPVDLEKRGFPISELEKPNGKLHNYTYARQVYKMWTIIREYVATIISKAYVHDASVRSDEQLANFVAEVRGGDGKTIDGGNMPLFPLINTLGELIDMVTMCIHIAAPQHTAVNYLQQFYLSFIPNRPGSLFTPLPKSVQELQNYGEKELMDALPPRSSDKWMMMAQVPYLLSEEVKDSQNILAYANDVSKHFNPVVAEAGKVLRQRINEITHTFKEMSAQNDDKVTEYQVMYPNLMASAIII